MKSTYRKYPLLLILFIVWEASAQTREVRFNLVTGTNGITLGGIGSITQDKYGFMWFADKSNQAIIRFDGNHMKLYRNDFKNPNSLGGYNPECLTTDSLGNIWIGFYGTGLDMLDPATGRFTHFRHDPKDDASLSNDVVSAVLVDHLGNVWVGSNGGLDLLNQKTGKFKHYSHNETDSTSLSHNVVRAIYEDRAGELWVGTGFFSSLVNIGGLNRFHRDNETFTQYLSDPANPQSLMDNRVKSIFEDSQGTFWIGTNGDGLHTLDRNTGLFKRLTYNPNQPEQLSRPPVNNSIDHITFITEDSDNKIWIGTWTNGLTRYDPSSKTITHYGNQEDKTKALNESTSWCAYASQDGLIWLGTGASNRLFKIDIYNTIIPHVDMGALIDFQEEGDSIGWYATATGLVRKDFRNGASRKFVHDPANPNSLSNSGVIRIQKDKTGNFWIGTFNGLNHFNLKTETFTRYNYNNGKDFGIAVADILDDSDSTIWVSTLGGGLDLRNWKTGKYTNYRHNANDMSTISNNNLTALYKDEVNNLWIGTLNYSGLNRLNLNTGRFKHYLQGLGSNCIHRDASGIMWVGTSAGLQRYNKLSDNFDLINDKNNENSIGDVIAIIGDKENNLWMSTVSGIYMLNKNRDQWYHYGKDYRIDKNKFIVGSSFIRQNGEIYFGDAGGYFSFYPEKLQPIGGNARLYFTRFWLNNKEITPDAEGPLKGPLHQTNEILLNHDENVFSFSATEIDFRHAQDKYIHYQLENFDDEWRRTRPEDMIHYNKVPPGKYIFRIKSAGNNKTEWIEKRIAVIIAPPWWRTWWAYLCLVAIISGSMFALYRFLLRQRLQQAETLRMRELDAVKTKLYTNITHEFRTPLTVIMGMAHQVLDNPSEHFKEGLKMIIRNGQNLLTLVNQMLDLSKLESGKLTLHYRQANVVSFLEYIVESFHSLAENKGVQIHFIPESEQLIMDFDEVRLQQIVSNLISNAIKFTPNGGHIYISGGTINDRFILKIKDTGIGIAEADLPYIFDRFYQADDSPTRHGEGTGIGLALTRELVKLMEGTIVVKSYKGKGAEFEVTLPARRVSDVEEKAIEVSPLTTNINKEDPAPMDDSSSSAWATQVLMDNRSANEGPHILIADDNEDVRAYLASCLKNDYFVETANNGQECEDLAFKITPDLIVLDVMMPFKDGFEVCKTLKTDERTSHIPIIMLTAKADLDSKLEGLEQGADDYLTKPFHKKELLLRIRNLLELRRQLQQYFRSTLEAGLSEEQPPNPKDVQSGIQNRSIPLANSLENAFVIKARKTIEEHLNDPDFDIEKLCRLLALSHSQVHRKLLALTGLSATFFIRYVRLVRAKELLLHSGFSIRAVALDSGFNDPAYFNRVFKQEFGVTPQAWREQNSN